MYSQFTRQTWKKSAGFDFVAAHFACENNRFSVQNPKGFVNFGSAQNFLNSREIRQRMAEVGWSDEDTHYQPFSGTPRCKSAIANHLESLAGVPVNPEHIIVGNGIISLLEALAIAVLDTNDKVLVPTPVFPGLVTALSLRARSNVVFLHTDPDHQFRLTPSAVQQAIERQAASDQPVKAVLLCSPGNPVGQIFNASDIASLIGNAEQYGCVLIVDEVYAASCFEGSTFHSAISAGSDRVFVLGGLSKDFGLAGYATGWLHGLNTQVMTAVARQSHFFRLPTPIQLAIEYVLEQPWKDEFVGRNRQKLTEKYWVANEAFREMGVSVTPADAGLCLWLDLRASLDTPDEDGQMRLYQSMLYDHRVHMSPSIGFHCLVPGFFRICFSQEDATLREGLCRIQRGLENLSSFSYSQSIEVPQP